jgi:hypothetical protein
VPDGGNCRLSRPPSRSRGGGKRLPRPRPGGDPARAGAAVPPLACLPREGLAGRQALGVRDSSGASYGSTGGSTWLKWHSPATGRGRSAARWSRAAAGERARTRPSTRWHRPMSRLPQTPTALACFGPGPRVRPATRSGLHPEGGWTARMGLLKTPTSVAAGGAIRSLPATAPPSVRGASGRGLRGRGRRRHRRPGLGRTRLRAAR